MPDQTLSRPLLLLTALLQGFILLFLHLSIEHDFWPAGQYHWLVSFYTMATFGPLMLMLSFDKDNIRKTLFWIGGFTIISGFLGFYIGLQAQPFEKVSQTGLFFAYGLTMTIASFKFLMYAQQYGSGLALSYSNLFRFSWRNFLTLVLSGLFTLAFWGILMLWAALFKLIKIDFFLDIFCEEWFFYPVLATVNGFGIIIFRNQSKVIDVLTRIQQALMKYLLLILIFVSILFLCALPFTGLSALWDTKSGSTIILWMQALILFFLNAVYQDEPEQRPYSLILHRYIYLGIALLPIYSAISFYGLYLRIDQYGWSVGRSWGVMVWLTFALFSLGYLWSIIKKRDQWIDNLSWVNIRMGLFVLASMILINSPLVDFRKLAVSSQMARLDSGKVSYEEFDYYYFKYHLGAPGYEALQSLKERIKDTHPDAAKKIEEVYIVYQQSMNELEPKEEFEKSLQIWPKTESLPEGLIAAIHAYRETHVWAYLNTGAHHILVIDLNNDGQNDYLYLSTSPSDGDGRLFSYANNGWEDYTVNIQGDFNTENAETLLEQETLETTRPEWDNIKIGDVLIKVSPY